MNRNFSWPHLDKSYVVRKLSILEAYMCSFSMIAQKINYYSSSNFSPENYNLEKFRSTELYDAPRINNFSLPQLHEP